MPAGARFGVAEGREEGGAELERCWEAEWGGPRQVAWEAAVAEVERRGQGATPEAERRGRCAVPEEEAVPDAGTGEATRPGLGAQHAPVWHLKS